MNLFIFYFESLNFKLNHMATYNNYVSMWFNQ